MRIPKKAKRVFKGIIHDVFHWPQQMFDGSTETFEALKRKDSVVVLATVGKKILIGYQQQVTTKPFVGLFGGQVDKAETPPVAAKREFLEETGYASSHWELWDVHEPSAKMEWKVYNFIARNCRKVAEQHLENGERIWVKKVSFQQFLKLVQRKDFREREMALHILRLQMNKDQLKKFARKLFA